MRLAHDHPELGELIEETGREALVDLVETLLLLVDEARSREWIERRSRGELEQLEHWAGRIHLRASDNAVRIPPRPACLDEAA
jgi:hypothetical protein